MFIAYADCLWKYAYRCNPSQRYMLHGRLHTNWNFDESLKGVQFQVRIGGFIRNLCHCPRVSWHCIVHKLKQKKLGFHFCFF